MKISCNKLGQDLALMTGLKLTRQTPTSLAPSHLKYIESTIMVPHIYLIRHAESLHNVTKDFSQLDPPLTRPRC